MLKTYAVYNPGTDQVLICGIDPDLTQLPTEIHMEIPDGSSKLAIRYGVSDSSIVDNYQGYTDEEVIELTSIPDVSEAPAQTLDEMKQLAIRAVRDFFEGQVSIFKSDAAPYEVATWETQRIEYSEWVRDPNASIPYCRALAAGRGISLELLMDKIYIKITRLAAAQGQQHALETAILNAASPEELSLTLNSLPL